MLEGQCLLELGNVNIPKSCHEFNDSKVHTISPPSMVDVIDSRGYETSSKNVKPIKVTKSTASKQDPRRASMPNVMPMTKSNERLLQDAVISGDITTIKSLLENGANPYYKNRKGWNVVHLAAYHNKDTAVQTLIDKNVDAQATDTEGKTPLHIAAERGNKTVMKILVDSGACPHKEDQSGTTVVQIAKNSVVRQVLETEVLEMLDDFSDLEKYMEEASISSQKFRFRVRMCTAYLGMMLATVTVVLRLVIFTKADYPSLFEYLLILVWAFGAFAALGAMPNNGFTIRIGCCLLNAIFLLFGFRNAMLFFTRLLVEMHEIQDLDDEVEHYCGKNIPQLNCGLMIGRNLAIGIGNSLFFISLCRNLRKNKGKKMFNFKNENGSWYNDNAFKVPARTALNSWWFHFRLSCAVEAVVYCFSWVLLCRAFNDPDRIPFFTNEVFKVFMIRALGLFSLVVSTTPGRRHRLMAFISNKVGKRHARLATSVMAMFGRRSVKQALTLARHKFRTISFEQCCKADYTSSFIKYETTFSKTVKARLGSCDAFVSHSWSDDGSQKFETLCEWCLDFKLNNGREPQLWLDKDCIKKNSISDDLSCLPFFLSGSKKLVILAGPTYNERLWCIIEVFLFLTMGGKINQIEVLPIEPEVKNTIASSFAGKEKKIKDFAQKMFENIDADSSKCEHENERQMLLAVIEAGFGDVHEFNRIMRQVFKNEKISELLSMKHIRDSKSAKLQTIRSGKTESARAENCQVHPMEQ